MITRDQIESYRLALSTVSTSALTDLRGLLDELVGVDTVTATQILFEVVPTVFDPYAATVSNVAATFYEETRALAGAKHEFTPRALDVPIPPGSWEALVGVSTMVPEFDAEGVDAVFSTLSGGLVKRLTETAAETVLVNGAADPDAPMYQRVPAAGCCGFCGMVASRGAVYGSRESAGKVVGRGMPISQTLRSDGSRKSGGQARGVKTRGKGKIGDSYHDNCKCAVVAVHSGNQVEMSADADKYYEAYREAADNFNNGLELRSTDYKLADGSIKSRYEWVDAEGKVWSPKERERAIAQAMSMDSGVMDAIAAQASPNRPLAHAELFEAATPKPSDAPLFTYEGVKHLSDDQLSEAMTKYWADDPGAWDKLDEIMDRRDADRLNLPAGPAPGSPYVDPFGTVLGGDTDPATNPAMRKERKLTPNERVAEEYWDYAQAQYLTALEDLNGVLFNKKNLVLAREKGITEDQLFSGPFHVANKYASDELREWWRANGRQTQTSYRYQALGRPSDYKAWLSVQKQGLHATGIRDARREDRRGL